MSAAPTELPGASPVLAVRGLTVTYGYGAEAVTAVEDVSFAVAPGEIVGLAGESGSGKSTLAFAAVRLLRPPARRVSGTVEIAGTDVYALDEEGLRAFRWAKVSIVTQSALNSLNPILSIGTQIADAIQAHKAASRNEAIERATECMRLVDLDPERLKRFPHQLSGGQRQRAVIAMALALRPPLMIFDEPTTALDVVVQRGILEKVRALKAEFGFSVLFITHDLSLLGEMADRVLVMYAGRLAESAPTATLFDQPLHPYTRGLMASFPSVFEPRETLTGIPGNPPDMRRPPPGCRFHPRCSQAMDRCRESVPPLLRTAEAVERHVACHLFSGQEAKL